MSQILTQFSGRAVYLDTMIPYALLRGIEPAAKVLFERIQIGEIMAYTSVLTFDELAYRLLLALIRDYYAGSPLERLRDEEEQMIAEFYPQLAPYLMQLRNFPHLMIVEVTTSDLEVMSDMILQYHVRPRDGLHIAAMQKVGCFDMVSHDSDFDRVPVITRYTLT